MSVWNGFQSAPLTKARGDPPSRGRRRRVRSRFNPLPSQKQGETYPRKRISGLRRVSIRSPHKSKGRPNSLMFSLLFRLVSIRSPHKSKGRRAERERPKGQGGVSIRSPHKSKGRPRPTRSRSAPVQSFNPLPSQKQGETARRRI